MKSQAIVISECDMEHLRHLTLGAHRSLCRDQQQVDLLDHVLETAEVRPPDRMPKNVISINSRVQVRDIDTQKEEVYTVVLPHEATASLRQVSVLAPIGIALLGQRKGLLVEGRVPGGIRRLRIMQVTQSPDSPSKKELSAHGEITRTSFAETLEAH